MKRSQPVELFEELFRTKWNVKHAYATSSFRIGLFHTLKSLDLKPGDEVLLGPITIPDTVNSIHVQGLKPVFVDLDFHNHNLDLEDFQKAIGPRSKVLLVTHLAGIAPDIEKICRIARKHGLFIIEDFSQAYGANHAGQYLGSFGDIGIGSLSIGKNITSLVGGIIITNNDSMMARIKKLAGEELHPPVKLTFLYQLLDNIKINIITSRWGFSLFFYYVLRILFWLRPNKMSTIHERKYIERYIKREIFFDDVPKLRSELPPEFFFWFSNWQAGLATKMLKGFEKANRRRQELAKVLYDHLEPEVKKLIPANEERFWQNTYYHFPINVKGDCKPFQQFLFRKGIDSAGYGLTLCSHEEIFSPYYRKTAVAAQIKESSLFLPVHEDFSESAMMAIANAVNEFCLRR